MSGGRPPPDLRLRALVTRPRHQAGRLAARLRTRGTGCLVEPMLEIAPMPWDAAAALEGRQAVLLTSANAAVELLRAAAGLAGGMAALPPVLAVGAATARPLRRAGFTRVEAARGANAADLLRLVRARLDPRRGPIAYLSGEAVACDLAAALAPTGFAVDRWVVYAARPAQRLGARTRAAIARGAVQVAPFLSARAAAAFHGLLVREGLEGACRSMAGVALSPRVAEAMRPLPWRTLAVAERPDLDGLLEALDRCLAGLVAGTSGGLAVQGRPRPGMPAPASAVPASRRAGGAGSAVRRPP
jgi:uroporphyrinogen-III synthase